MKTGSRAAVYLGGEARSWTDPKALFVVAVALLLAAGGVAMILLEVNPLFVLAFLAALFISAASRSSSMLFLSLYMVAIFFDHALGSRDAFGSPAMLLGICVALLLLMRGLLARDFQAPHLSAWLFFAFCFWGLLTVFWSIDADQSRQAFITIFGLAAVAVVLSVSRFTDRELAIIREVVVAGGTLAALFGLFLFFFGQFAEIDYPEEIEVRRLVVAFASDRWIDPNHFSASLILPIALSLSGIVVSRGFWPRAWRYLAFTTMVLATILSLSRGGILGVGVVVLFVLWRLKAASLRSLVVFAILGGVAWQFLPVLLVRFTGPGFWSGAGRTTIWQVGLEALKTYWVTGSGMGSFSTAYNEFMLQGNLAVFQRVFQDAHNIYLQLAVEVGVVGLALFVAAVVRLLRGLRQVDRPTEGPLPAVFLEAALVGLLVVGSFLGILRGKYLWLSVGLSMLVALRQNPAPAPAGTPAPGRETVAAGRLP